MESALCRQLGEVAFDFCRDAVGLLHDAAEVAIRLNVEPELRALFEEFPQLERHLRRDGAAPQHDFVDAPRAHAQGPTQRVLRTEAQRR